MERMTSVWPRRPLFDQEVVIRVSSLLWLPELSEKAQQHKLLGCGSDYSAQKPKRSTQTLAAGPQGLGKQLVLLPYFLLNPGPSLPPLAPQEHPLAHCVLYLPDIQHCVRPWALHPPSAVGSEALPTRLCISCHSDIAGQLQAGLLEQPGPG